MTKKRYAPFLEILLLVFFLVQCGSSGSGEKSADAVNDTSAGDSSSPTTQPALTGFCPPYKESSIFRARPSTLVVSPSAGWMDAIENATPGTEIILKKGTYNLTRYGVYVGDELTIRGETGNPKDVLIKGEGYGPMSEGFIIEGKNSTISDLSITAIRNHGISIKTETGAQAPTIYNVDLYDIGTQMIKMSFGNADSTPVANGIVACSRMGYNPGKVRGDYIAAIDLHRLSNWTIRDNFIYNFMGDGTGCEVDVTCGLYPATHPAILLWNQGKGLILERNTIIDSFRSIALGLGKGFESAVVRNNFIYRPASGDAGIELQGTKDILVANNAVLIGNYRGAIELRDSTDVRVVNNLISSPVLDRGGNSNFTQSANITNATSADLIKPYDFHVAEDSRVKGQGIALDAGFIDPDGDTPSLVWDVGADFL